MKRSSRRLGKCVRSATWPILLHLAHLVCLLAWPLRSSRQSFKKFSRDTDIQPLRLDDTMASTSSNSLAHTSLKRDDWRQGAEEGDEPFLHRFPPRAEMAPKLQPVRETLPLTPWTVRGPGSGIPHKEPLPADLGRISSWLTGSGEKNSRDSRGAQDLACVLGRQAGTPRGPCTAAHWSP